MWATSVIGGSVAILIWRLPLVDWLFGHSPICHTAIQV